MPGDSPSCNSHTPPPSERTLPSALYSDTQCSGGCLHTVPGRAGCKHSQQRGGNNPDLVQFAVDCERYGADGITIHPRPDERHIRREDVFLLKNVITTEYNIEGFPSNEFVNLVLKAKPHQVTLVPDSPDVLTSNKNLHLRSSPSVPSIASTPITIPS